MSFHLLSETNPRARKRHRCIWCGEGILKGELYTHEKSVYDGNMQDHKWHLECREDSIQYLREEAEFAPMSFERPEERLGFEKGE